MRSKPPTVSPGEEYGQVGICLPASSCSQLGAYLASSFMGDKEGMFVQVSLTISGTGVSSGRSVRTGPPDLGVL